MEHLAVVPPPGEGATPLAVQVSYWSSLPFLIPALIGVFIWGFGYLLYNYAPKRLAKLSAKLPRSKLSSIQQIGTTLLSCIVTLLTFAEAIMYLVVWIEDENILVGKDLRVGAVILQSSALLAATSLTLLESDAGLPASGMYACWMITDMVYLFINSNPFSGSLYAIFFRHGLYFRAAAAAGLTTIAFDLLLRPTPSTPLPEAIKVKTPPTDEKDEKAKPEKETDSAPIQPDLPTKSESKPVEEVKNDNIKKEAVVNHPCLGYGARLRSTAWSIFSYLFTFNTAIDRIRMDNNFGGYNFDQEDALHAQRLKDMREKRLKERKEKQAKIVKKIGSAGFLNWRIYWSHKTLLLSLFWPNDIKFRAAVGVKLVYLLFARYLNLRLPKFYGEIIDKATAMTSPSDLSSVIWIVILWQCWSIMEGYGISWYISSFLDKHIEQVQSLGVETYLNKHILTMSEDFFTSEDPNELSYTISRSQEYLGAIQELVMSTIPSFVDSILSVWLCYSTFGIEVSYILVAAVLLSLVISSVEAKVSAEASRIQRQRRSRLYMIQSEALRFWDIVSAFAQQDYEVARFTHASILSFSGTVMSTLQKFGFRLVSTLISQVASSTVYIIIAVRIYRGTATTGDLVLAITQWSTFFRDCTEAVTIYQDVSYQTEGIQSVIDLINREPGITDGENPIDHQLAGEMEFKDVSFHYKPETKVSDDDEDKDEKEKETEGSEKKDPKKMGGFSNVSFKVKAGQTVAVVGKSGSGKTTLVKMVYRAYNVDSGEILVDGIPMNDVRLRTLRQQIAIVPQKSTLFPRSVRENLKYANRDATEEEIHAACKKASIHDRFISMEKGYDSEIGPRGEKLSGGEAQRLSVARVFLIKNPAIMVLDEASSALDTETEQHIQLALQENQHTTKFVVAHRLSTIKGADLILVMDDGKVVEQGGFQELLQKGGRFTTLWNLQTAETSAAQQEEKKKQQEKEQKEAIDEAVANALAAEKNKDDDGKTAVQEPAVTTEKKVDEIPVQEPAKDPDFVVVETKDTQE